MTDKKLIEIDRRGIDYARIAKLRIKRESVAYERHEAISTLTEIMDAFGDYEGKREEQPRLCAVLDSAKTLLNKLGVERIEGGMWLIPPPR